MKSLQDGSCYPKHLQVPGDYDRDGKTDVAMYRDEGQSGTQALWFIKRSSDGGTTVVQWGGLLQDIPVPGDYDGDGKTDPGRYRDGTWFIRRSFDGGVTGQQGGEDCPRTYQFQETMTGMAEQTLRRTETACGLYFNPRMEEQRQRAGAD